MSENTNGIHWILDTLPPPKYALNNCSWINFWFYCIIFSSKPVACLVFILLELCSKCIKILSCKLVEHYDENLWKDMKISMIIYQLLLNKSQTKTPKIIPKKTIFLIWLFYSYFRLFCASWLRTVTRPHIRSLFKLCVKNIKFPYWLCQTTCNSASTLASASWMPRATRGRLFGAPLWLSGTGARKDPHLTSSKNTSSNRRCRNSLYMYLCEMNYITWIVNFFKTCNGLDSFIFPFLQNQTGLGPD